MDRPRILLTGASGLLGRALLPELERAGEVVAPGLDLFDLDRPETVVEVITTSCPTLVVHLAADTRVDRCEEHPADAFRINTQGTIHVATAARIAGARMVVMSTDYVFNGAKRRPYREYEATGPLSVYGRSKAEAERATLAIVPDRLIVRSSSLFGPGGSNFVDSILERARAGEPIRVVDDQIQSPTFVGHLAPALACAALSRAQGILHLSGGEECSWLDFARAILDAAGLDRPCEAVSSRAFARPAPRPSYSVLDCGLAESMIGHRLPSWRDALAAYLGTRG